MIKVGLIGCGFMGGMHMACYGAIENVKVTAVCDIRAEKLDEAVQKTGATPYTSGEEMIKNADVDVIDICLPTYLHIDYAVMAMEAGKDVFVEKPVTRTMEQAQRFLEVAAKTGRQVQVGQVIRFWKEYMKLKEIKDAGTYGKVLSASFRRLSNKAEWDWENWFSDAERSGSMALDLHIHDVDYMRYLLGEPVDMYAACTRDEKGNIQRIFTTYKYPNEVAVSVEGGWGYAPEFPFAMEFTVSFEKAIINFIGGEMAIYPVEGGKIIPTFENAFSGTLEGGNVSDLGGYFNELKYFIDNLSAKKPLEVAPLDQAVKSLDLVLKEIAFVGGAGRNIQ